MELVRYTKDHEYVRLSGEIGVVGVSYYAQQQLGDVVFVELPELGRALIKGAQAAVVESVKAASEVFSPVGGEVVDVNQRLEQEPALVNAEPMDGGWFYKLRLRDPAELESLMDEDAYRAFVSGLR
jgi:glycine cleavage system H protein